MNSKEIFEKVADHLKAQGERSFIAPHIKSCAYYGTEEKKCAVGCLILPEFYYSDIENLPLVNPKVRRSVELSIGRPLTGIEMEMLETIQCIHDTAPLESWEDRLSFVYETYFSQGELV